MAHFSEKDDVVVTIKNDWDMQHGSSHSEQGNDSIEWPLDKKAYPTGRGFELPEIEAEGELFYNRSDSTLYIADGDEWVPAGLSAHTDSGIPAVDAARYDDQKVGPGDKVIMNDVDQQTDWRARFVDDVYNTVDDTHVQLPGDETDEYSLGDICRFSQESEFHRIHASEYISQGDITDIVIRPSISFDDVPELLLINRGGSTFHSDAVDHNNEVATCVTRDTTEYDVDAAQVDKGMITLDADCSPDFMYVNDHIVDAYSHHHHTADITEIEFFRPIEMDTSTPDTVEGFNHWSEVQFEYEQPDVGDVVFSADEQAFYQFNGDKWMPSTNSVSTHRFFDDFATLNWNSSETSKDVNVDVSDYGYRMGLQGGWVVFDCVGSGVASIVNGYMMLPTYNTFSLAFRVLFEQNMPIFSIGLNTVFLSYDDGLEFVYEDWKGELNITEIPFDIELDTDYKMMINYYDNTDTFEVIINDEQVLSVEGTAIIGHPFIESGYPGSSTTASVDYFNFVSRRSGMIPDGIYTEPSSGIPGEG